MVNPYREPGMERYWVPSMPESALFGTKIADRFFDVNVGGDIAFLTGTLQAHDRARLGATRDFVDEHTDGLRRARARRWPSADWERARGAARAPARDEMLAFARLLGEARSARCSSGRWA